MSEHAAEEGKRVLVLGHSFVRRVSEFFEKYEATLIRIQNGQTVRYADKIIGWRVGSNLGFDKRFFQVQFHGEGGLTLNNAKPQKALTSRVIAEVIRNSSPHHVFLDVGSNDLCDVSADPVRLAKQIFSFAEYLTVAYSVEKVIVGSVFPRIGKGVPYPSYNDKVSVLNQQISKMAAGHAQVSVWRHRGFVNPEVPVYNDGGVHLGFMGNGAYACSLKRAISRLEKHVRH